MNSNGINSSALIYDIKRFTIHDGPGIRTTVFFKGCPLNCIWCHNPESRSPVAEKYIRENRIGEKIFHKEELIGKEYSIPELIKEIEKDKIFFEESNGGVTFSGGEPLSQIDFLVKVLEDLKTKKIHKAIDTCGYASLKDFEKIIGKADLYLFDLKVLDDNKHFQYTGVSNKTILINLKQLSEAGCRIFIRFPVIPGFNNNDENINNMIKFLKTIKFEQVDLLKYHNTAKGKCKRFGKEYQMPDIPNAKKEDLTDVKKKFEKEGLKVSIL
jgi:pyruvate formate lyase activating enzyme